ncbi:unnamed protein product [Rhizoctonia solani]|uniref:Uncharacterized protein n=1 Tax=Rhizoctonia solani TaxID=456999 RepID=A0A8H3C2X4_9AGAM|nr:unnamed protein product [Rhizoctonia solani]
MSTHHTTHQVESARPSHSIRHGEFAYPPHAVQLKEKRCLEASRREHVSDSTYIDVGGYQVRRCVSAGGLLYFCYEQFLSPNNLTNSSVFWAFLVALRELSQYLVARSNELGRYEVVITLQCISPTEPQFSYYFVDHYLRRVSDESVFVEDVIANCGTVRWNVAYYWEHIAIFSAHRLCTAADYDQARMLLLGLQYQASAASPDLQHDDTQSDLEILHNMLSGFSRTSIGMHATASIARIMTRVLAAPPAPKPRSPSLGSTILRSLRGIIPLRNPCENEDHTHPTKHEDPFESVLLPNEPDDQNSRGDSSRRNGWRNNE